MRMSVIPTVEVHGFVILSERVGRDARVLAVVGRLDVVYSQAQHDRVVLFVIGVDAVLGRARHSPSVLLPVVDGLRVSGDDALEDRLAAERLAHPPVRQLDLRRNCISNRQVVITTVLQMLSHFRPYYANVHRESKNKTLNSCPQLPQM